MKDYLREALENRSGQMETDGMNCGAPHYGGVRVTT
jgi:hypothetical protein